MGIEIASSSLTWGQPSLWAQPTPSISHELEKRLALCVAPPYMRVSTGAPETLVGVAEVGVAGSGVARTGVASSGVARLGVVTGLADSGAGRGGTGVADWAGVLPAPGVIGVPQEMSRQSAASRMQRRMATSRARRWRGVLVE